MRLEAQRACRRPRRLRRVGRPWSHCLILGRLRVRLGPEACLRLRLLLTICASLTSCVLLTGFWLLPTHLTFPPLPTSLLFESLPQCF